MIRVGIVIDHEGHVQVIEFMDNHRIEGGLVVIHVTDSYNRVSELYSQHEEYDPLPIEDSDERLVNRGYTEAQIRTLWLENHDNTQDDLVGLDILDKTRLLRKKTSKNTATPAEFYVVRHNSNARRRSVGRKRASEDGTRSAPLNDGDTVISAVRKHLRNQPCGPGHKERKLIWVRAHRRERKIRNIDSPGEVPRTINVADEGE